MTQIKELSIERKGEFIVARIKAVKNVSQLSHNIGGAVAPLGFSLTPTIQDYNMYRRYKHLDYKDFIEMAAIRINKVGGIFMDVYDEYIDVYCTIEKFEKSTYRQLDFIEGIYKQSFLPIEF